MVKSDAGRGPQDGDREGSNADPVVIEEEDGTILRLAPGSAWSREQVGPAGGRRTMVTRLERGRLGFSAGRSRSPWRHEVQVGPARASTTKGRFQAVAETDGGATITCLSGRTRVFAGLREPVELKPDQTAAISSDGSTLIVMEGAQVDTSNESTEGDAPAEGETPTDAAWRPDPDEALARLISAVSARDHIGSSTATGLSVPEADPEPPAASAEEEVEPPIEPLDSPVEPRRRRRGIVADLVAVAALLAVLVAAAILFTRSEPDDEVATPSVPVTTAAPAATTVPEATTAPPPTTSEPAPPTTEPATRTVPAVVSNPGAQAQGDLRGCSRDGGVVRARVEVTQTGGGRAAFLVRVALVDATGPFSQGTATSSMLDGGSAELVDVEIPLPEGAGGSCELLAVQAV